MRGPYQTKQLKLIWEYLEKYPSQSHSAKELYAAFYQTGSPVGLATIYRHLEQLAQDGHAKRVVTSDGASKRFQYATGGDTQKGFYLKCDHCGALIYMNCELLHEVTDHMIRKHGFQLDEARSVLYGRCQNCIP